MEDFDSFWTYQQGLDEIKQKLLCATIELESAKMEANQEMMKNKESVKNLMNLLQMAYRERDEAKNQLQKVLNELMLTSHFQAESPVGKANSSITESNSLSADTFNNNPQSQSQSLGSPVVDSFFDAVSSTDFSSLNVGDSYNVDPCGLVIENIVKGKKLPEKGRLLQSVMEAGPLLQTLLVAGPLPRWRNPPPLQPFKIPPVLMKGEGVVVNSPRMCSSSMLNFSGVPSESCCLDYSALVSGSNPSFGCTKRQRLV
ncbi:hypothetical protein SDJN02_00521 [Cucurbita argyrosperma subsp. argyrosperma]